MLTGNIFVTGGAGFLGRGLMRRATHGHWDCSFTVYSRDEEKQRLAHARYNARYVLGDIADFERLRLSMMGHETVIHAAAAKYIPQSEANPSWCIRVNIDGTRSVIDAARASGVRQVVIISSDKAPNPANTYGMTKALCERLVGETFNGGSRVEPQLIACRYGNVVGSTGSIWPVWKKQAEAYGFLGLTDPSMSRYYMSVDQAIDIIQASLSVHTSGLVVLDKVRACNMGALAKYIAGELGVEIREVGRRPGEKTHEQMVVTHELSRLRAFQDDKYCILPPGNETTDEPPVGYEQLLTSSDPYEWLTPADFVAIAHDSEWV